MRQDGVKAVDRSHRRGDAEQVTTTAAPLSALPLLGTSTRPAPAPACPVVVGVCRATWPARWRRDQPRPLHHAVEAHRCAAELEGEPELALCGAFVAVTGPAWTTADTARCPECDRLVRGVPEASR